MFNIITLKAKSSINTLINKSLPNKLLLKRGLFLYKNIKLKDKKGTN
jgi:hypothetical protein